MQPYNVLIVDDDPQVTLALSIRLRAAGYVVDTAPDGETGLEKLALKLPDVVLLDMRMPGIDGLEVIRRMKMDERLSRVPVIVISANAQETVKREAIATGAKLFLEKPYESRVLLDALTRVLARDREMAG